jgi:low affinity Fe/Cu permease
MVVLWAPSYFLVKKIDTWQLIINTTTTIVTFLLVAVSQNAASRAEAATNRKTDAIADALADFLEFYAEHTESDKDKAHLLRDADDLRRTVGLQERTGAQ